MHNESLLERFNRIETRMKNLEAIIGMQPNKTSSAPPHNAKGQRYMVLRVLEDGLERTVQKIASQASILAGRKQKKQSIHAICSELFLSGKLERVSPGVYRKKGN